MENHFFHNLNFIRVDCLPILLRQSQKHEDTAVHENQAVLVHFSDHTRITQVALGVTLLRLYMTPKTFISIRTQLWPI